jgi:cell wall-associated NlpC family hydrolase
VVLGFVTAAGFPLWMRAPAAAADTVSDKQAEAAQIAAKISALGQQINVLADQYDEAQIHAQAVAGQLSAVKARVTADRVEVRTAEKQLRVDALDAFTNEGSLTSGDAFILGQKNLAIARTGFLDTMTVGEQSTVTDLHLAQRTLARQERGLQGLEQQSQLALAQIGSARQAAEQVSDQEQSLLDSVQGQLAQLVAEAQTQQEAEQAQQQAEQAQVAAQQAEQTQAQPASAPAASAAAPSPAEGIALAAAETQLGVPYVFGGDTPGVGFDCSGLVMWAFAQAGVSFAHYVPAIYAAVQPIPESELEPGDLVFAPDLSHVGIYVGNGMMIDAPYTGTVVQIRSMSFMTLAGRVT